MSAVHCVLLGRERWKGCSEHGLQRSFPGLFLTVLGMQLSFVSSRQVSCNQAASQCIVVMAQSSHACLFMLSVHQHSSVSEMVGIRQHRRRTQSYSERRLEAKAVSLSPGKNEDIHSLVGVCFLECELFQCN